LRAIFGIIYLTNTFSFMQEISVKDLESKMPLGEKSLLIDVRTPDEYSRGHIPGAINKPIETIQNQSVDLGFYDEIFINCLTGGRSSQACQILVDLGLTSVRNVSGGVSAWEVSGFEVEKS
jgi:thioredoxin 1